MQEILDYILLKINNDIIITVRSVVVAFVGFILARLISFLIRRILKAYLKKRNIDMGRSYTVITLVKYITYFIIFLIVLNLVGIKLNLLLAGSAALLVGVGLGLQNTFNDFFSGLILLVDGTIEVGDVLEIEGQKAMVKYIGLRTSRLEDNDNHVLIIPNSQLVNNRVENYSGKDSPIRFTVPVSVAYGSDIKKVEKILLDVIKPFSRYKMNYRPSVFLSKYGDSSIDFKLFFYSEDFFLIDKTLSDIRKAIILAFEKEGIEIPFPQRDVWIRDRKSENSQ